MSRFLWFSVYMHIFIHQTGSKNKTNKYNNLKSNET